MKEKYFIATPLTITSAEGIKIQVLALVGNDKFPDRDQAIQFCSEYTEQMKAEGKKYYVVSVIEPD